MMNNLIHRDFKGIWIPKELWLNKSLSIMEKVFVAEVDSLDTGEGCYASNKYFAEFFNITPKRASAIISDLVRKKYFVSRYSYKGNSKEIDKRFLRLSVSFLPQNISMGGGIPKNEDTPPDFQGGGIPENREDITKRYNKDHINQSKYIDKTENGTTTNDLIDDDLEFLFSEITKNKVTYKDPSEILRQAKKHKCFANELDSATAKFLHNYWNNKYVLNSGWNSGAWFVSDFLIEAAKVYQKQKDIEQAQLDRVNSLYEKYSSEPRDFKEEFGRFADKGGNDKKTREFLLNKNYSSIDDINDPIIQEDFLRWRFAC